MFTEKQNKGDLCAMHKYTVCLCKKPRESTGIFIKIEWPVELRKGEVIQLAIPKYDHIAWIGNKEFWMIDHIIHRSNKMVYSHSDIYVTPVKS